MVKLIRMRGNNRVTSARHTACWSFVLVRQLPELTLDVGQLGFPFREERGQDSMSGYCTF